MKLHQAFAIAATLLLPPAAQAADIRLIGAVASKSAVAEILPAFERAQGHRVAATWASTVTIKARLAAGEVYDVIILRAPEIDALTQQGTLAPGSRVDLMRSGIGMAVRAGAPKPDISSAEALKNTLLAAKTIGYSTGASGAHLKTLLDRMNIAERVGPKLRLAPPSETVGNLIANGDTEIGFQQISEVQHFPGIDYVGPLPAEVQQVTVFSAATPNGATHPQPGKALMTYIAGPAGDPAIRKHGLEPSPPR